MGTYADVMKTLNKEVLAGFDLGHMLLGLGAAGALGYSGLPRNLSRTLNKDVPMLGGLDYGHVALALGLLSTLGIGYYKR